MKTNELAGAITAAAQWLKPTQTAEMLKIAHELEHASARHLKKSREAYTVRLERKNHPSVHFEPVFEWIPCDGDGHALTPTGRVMTAKHDILGYR